MSANEQPENEAQREPEEDEAGGHEVPLFLRDRSDGRKGNAQDEKDETGE